MSHGKKRTTRRGPRTNRNKSKGDPPRTPQERRYKRGAYTSRAS